MLILRLNLSSLKLIAFNVIVNTDLLKLRLLDIVIQNFIVLLLLSWFYIILLYHLLICSLFGFFVDFVSFFLQFLLDIFIIHLNLKLELFHPVFFWNYHIFEFFDGISVELNYLTWFVLNFFQKWLKLIDLRRDIDKYINRFAKNFLGNYHPFAQRLHQLAW